MSPLTRGNIRLSISRSTHVEYSTPVLRPQLFTQFMADLKGKTTLVEKAKQYELEG